MSTTTDALKSQLATREDAAVAPNGKPSVRALIEQMKPEIARALPRHMDADRLARIALTMFRQTPKLQECSPESFLGALMTTSQLGLEPGPLGHAYFVPFKGQVQFILGYKGMIELARRSGNIDSLIAREVYGNDRLEVAYGLEDRLVHEPTLFGPRGPVVAVYAIAKYAGGGHSFVVLSREDVEERRKRSRAKDSGPWVTDWTAMAKKTAVRALAAFLPLSVEMAQALGQDEQVRTEVQADALDATPTYADAEVVDVETGELLPAPADGEPAPEVLDAEFVAEEPPAEPVWPEAAKPGGGIRAGRST